MSEWIKHLGRDGRYGYRDSEPRVWMSWHAIDRYRQRRPETDHCTAFEACDTLFSILDDATPTETLDEAIAFETKEWRLIVGQTSEEDGLIVRTCYRRDT